MSKPLSIGKILTGPTYTLIGEGNILTPVVDIVVIAENGGLFRRTFLAFGLTEKGIITAWENEPDKFLKIAPATLTQKPTP